MFSRVRTGQLNNGVLILHSGPELGQCEAFTQRGSSHCAGENKPAGLRAGPRALKNPPRDEINVASRSLLGEDAPEHHFTGQENSSPTWWPLYFTQVK